MNNKKLIKLVLISILGGYIYGWGLSFSWLDKKDYLPAPGKEENPGFMEWAVIGRGNPEDDLRRLEEYLIDMSQKNEIFLQTTNGDPHWYKVEVTPDEEVILVDYLNPDRDNTLFTLKALNAIPGVSTPVLLSYYSKPPQEQMVDGNNAVLTTAQSYSNPYTGSLPANAPDWLKNVPWYLVQDGVDYVKRTYNADLGTWETYLMAAIWDAEGAKLDTAFGIRHYDNAYDKAEECAATIYKYINRFWNHLEEIKNNPQEAEQFGKALVATAALELYRAGEDLFEYFRANVLKMLVPDYLDFLNRGKESNIDKADTATKRLSYARFLLEFIPEDFSANFDYRKVARYFLDKFQSASESDQFLIFATFLLPYEGMNYSSGYCPIWDMGGAFWRGAYEEKPGHFELNSNWGMNVYSNLSYLLREMPTIPVTTPIV
ncbi:MAG TPA: hypothetical protein ENG39_01830, partial [Candidatus Omnitrophica bacterium]|nr:hypothetical protein [Candidatus Omnitrophota bacterium]